MDKQVAEVSGLRSTKLDSKHLATLLLAAEAGDLRY